MKFSVQTQFASTALTFMVLLLAIGCGEKTTDESSDADSDSDSGADTSVDTNTVDSDTGSGEATPIDDVTSLANQTYVLDAIDGDYWLPAGVGSELGGYVPSFAFQIQSVVAPAVTALVGTMEANAQNLCSGTAPFEGTIADNPKFSIGPMDLETVIEGDDSFAVATIRDLAISGTFVNSGTEFEKGTLQATVDFRDIYPLFTILNPANADDVCSSAPTLGFACEACPHDNQIYCMKISASSVSGAMVPGLNLTEVGSASIECAEAK